MVFYDIKTKTTKQKTKLTKYNLKLVFQEYMRIVYLNINRTIKLVR